MKNPCEKCLVQPICMSPCENLDNFAKKMGTRNTYVLWLKNYECRPRVIELVKKLYKFSEKEIDEIIKEYAKNVRVNNIITQQVDL